MLIKANNEDASNLREWLSMKLYRKMGVPAPREAPAQVFLNGQILGFYFIVEHEDETFLARDFGENTGYLYEWEYGQDYEFNNLGTDPSLCAAFLNLKTNQSAADLQTFVNLVQAINQPSTGSVYINALSAYINPKSFLTYCATENVLSEIDGVLDGISGMNNFYLYQFSGQTLYYMIPWDKDRTLVDVSRDIMDGVTSGTNVNLLAQHLVAIPEYWSFYLSELTRAATLLGAANGWADQEITREYGVIHDAATNDPNKQCDTTGVPTPCGNQDFEAGVTQVHDFLSTRGSFVLTAATAAGYQADASDPQIPGGGIAAWGGAQAVSPGAIAVVTGSNFGTALSALAVPLPRILGSTVVSVEGVRAPLYSVAPGTIQFLVPGDLPLGSASIVVSNNGAVSGTVGTAVLASTPSILAVSHPDYSPVTDTYPPAPGEVLSIWVTGLGAAGGNVPIGAAGPSDPPATTITVPQVALGSVPVAVMFSGLAPSLVGLYQINVGVPDNWSPGNASASLILTDSGQSASWLASQ